MTEWWEEPDEPRWTDVGASDEWAVGSSKRVTIGARRIGVWRRGDDHWSALKDVCPHAGAALSDGQVDDHCAVCPLHGWRFDLDTGQGPGDASVACYPVRVVDGRVEVGV